MWPVSAGFLRALRQPYTFDARCDLYRSGTLVEKDIPIIDGSVTVDISSDVRRQARLTFDPLPQNLVNQFNIYDSEFALYWGMVWPSGEVEWCPLGVFRADSVTQAIEPGVIEMACPDRTQFVADYRFLTPQDSIKGNTIASEIVRLVHDAVPGAEIVDNSGAIDKVGPQTWERDRWPTIRDLGESIGCDVMFDAAGRLNIRPFPAITNPAVWSIDAGETGVLISGSRVLSRERTYNAVVAYGETVDGAPPIIGIAYDNDPTSPTYWDGPYGKKPRFFFSSFFTTSAQCLRAAQSYLDKARALNRQVTIECAPNPALAGGDVITVAYPDGTSEPHICHSIEIPLRPGNMRVTTRATQLDTGG